MIIIIRALPHSKKRRGQRSLNKKGGQRSPQKKEKKKGNVTIHLPHLCFKVAPCSSYRESLELSLSYTSGNFHYRTWLVYFNDGLPQMPQVFMRKQVGCTRTQFLFELSYTYSSSAFVAWQSLLLTLTSIDGHLHCPLISRVDVRLSPFCLLHTTSIIIFYSTHSAISMACTHVLRKG